MYRIPVEVYSYSKTYGLLIGAVLDNCGLWYTIWSHFKKGLSGVVTHAEIQSTFDIRMFDIKIMFDIRIIWPLTKILCSKAI